MREILYNRDFSGINTDNPRYGNERSGRPADENGYIRQENGDFIKQDSKSARGNGKDPFSASYSEPRFDAYPEKAKQKGLFDFSFLKNITSDDILLAAIGFILVFDPENSSDLLIILIALLLLT